jgi:hypothetical protein
MDCPCGKYRAEWQDQTAAMMSWASAVTQIHYSSLRINSTDDAFHDPHKGSMAEIGGEL